jgi:molybdate transport system permease protein
MQHLWQPLAQSFRIALLATLGAAVVAIPLAYFLARRRFPGKTALEALLIVPLVLPPTVVGYFLLVLLGHHGLISGPLHFSIVWKWYGAAVAAGVVAFPLLLMPARAAFAGVDRELEEIARLMGANRAQIFLQISLPLASRGIFAGLLLAFARALGEFGATVMVLGIQEDTRTLPIFVYEEYYSLNNTGLAAAVLILSLVALLIIVIYNRLPSVRV